MKTKISQKIFPEDVFFVEMSHFQDNVNVLASIIPMF